jgi:cyclic-di-GMP phosphodiesterase TipF (flagellum assembly factor)
MSNFTDALVTLGCAAAAAGASLLMLNGGASPGLAGVLGLSVFGVGSQLQNVAVRRRDRAALHRDLIALKRADLIVSDQVAQSIQQVESLLAKAEDEHILREGKLASELKLFETLLRQFAESMVKRVQAVEAAHAETAGQTRRLHDRLKSGAAPAATHVLPAQEAANDSHLFDLIQRSLIENRVDLYLQPVVSLPQRKLKYYEALSRLRTPDGALIMPAQYLRVAESRGLMSTVDNLLLFRCVQFIRRLTAKQRDVGVFCNISVHSLTDAAFFPQFVDFMRAHRDLAPQIVFELPQAAFEAMGPAEEASLKSLADLGFAFSMDRVAHLDFEIEPLRKRAIRFIKVAPSLLLNPDTQTALGIRLEDFRELLARSGIALVGEKIETERQVVDLLDFSIDYGQGYLFGEPRPLKEDDSPAMRTEERAPVAAAPAPPASTGMTALFQARAQKRAAG